MVNTGDLQAIIFIFKLYSVGHGYYSEPLNVATILFSIEYIFSWIFPVLL